MNKCLVLVMAAMLAVVFALPAASLAAGGPVIGKVIGVKGEATVTREGMEQGLQLAVKDPVYLMDRIRTGPDSRIKILMADDSIATLGQKAEMVLKEFEYSPDTGKRGSVLQLLAGNIRCLVSKIFSGAGSRFEVHTPTAVAGARGTVNIVSVVNQDRTLAVGIRGVTGVWNEDPAVGGEAELGESCGAGDDKPATYVDRAMPPSEIFCIGGEELKPLLDDTTLVRTPADGAEGGEGGEGGKGGKPEKGSDEDAPLVPPVDQRPFDYCPPNEY